MMIYLKGLRFSNVFEISIMCFQKNSRLVFSDESDVKGKNWKKIEYLFEIMKFVEIKKPEHCSGFFVIKIIN